MNVAEIITNRFIEELEKGNIPWQKPWKRVKGCEDLQSLFPCYSYSTGKRYDIMNQMLLDFEPGEYITFKQCADLGGKVKKGAKSKMVVGWIVEKKVLKDKNGNAIVDEDGKEETKTTFSLRYYNVFNIKDCENIKPHKVFEELEDAEETETVSLRHEYAENIIKTYIDRESTLTFEDSKPSDKAFYSPCEDKVVVPMIQQFECVEEYYSTSFHELTHSTMKASRCNREEDRKGKSVAFGSNEYSKEELVAEIGAATLVNICGLESEKSFRNSSAYIQSWIKALKNDKNLLVNACAKAEKAINYIIGQ